MRIRTKGHFDYVILTRTLPIEGLSKRVVHIVDSFWKNEINTFCGKQADKDSNELSLSSDYFALPVLGIIKSSLCKNCIKKLFDRLDDSMNDCAEVAKKIYSISKDGLIKDAHINVSISSNGVVMKNSDQPTGYYELP